MITVVIPYFQRQSGVLRKALASVAAQQGCPLPVHVIVVDDASPAPPADEIAAVNWPAGIQVRVLPRSNGGPGAARNSGLDAASPQTQFLAFLDSDDEWSPRHLVRAVAALEQGFDFYFADFYQLDQKVGAFARAGRLVPAQHPRLSGQHESLHQYQGDLFDQALRGNVVGTPTVVYRWQRLSHLRFRVEFTTAGEDYLFWMSVAREGARIAFSSEIETTCGKGVNVFSGSGWGTEGYLLRVHQEIGYRLAVRQLFSVNATQRQHIRRDLQRLRLGFVRDLLHRLRHRKSIPGEIVLAQIRRDPLLALMAPALVLRVVLGQ